MAKPNKNRKRFYDAYKSQGRRERNAKRKAALREKELAKYAARREDPDYQKARAERKIPKDPRDTVVKAERIGGWKSILDKIKFSQEKEAREARRIESKLEGKS